MVEAPDGGISADLIRRCRAIIIFPSVLKAGLGLGGHYGSGLILSKKPGGRAWGPPAFLTIKGGSIGWQAGVQSTDLVILVMNDVDLGSLFKDNFTIGADAAIAVGPLGRAASAGADIDLTKGMISYSRAKGVFLGLSLKGSILEPDWDANENYYGSDSSMIDIFYHRKGKVTRGAADLIRLLYKYGAPKKK
jgi:lipid-binding SYLF domain-containing protein